MSETYTFSNLQSQDHFRLVRILPGERNTPLQCTLSEFSLEGSPAYEALSYARGTEDEIRPTIVLDGQQFSITTELEKALRRLRWLDTVRIMWIDQICINQTHTAERSAQVALMPGIYHGAERVIAWIGEETDDSERALSFLREMASHQKWLLLDSDTSSERSEIDLDSSHRSTDVAESSTPNPGEEEHRQQREKFQTYFNDWKVLPSKIVLDEKISNYTRWGHMITGVPVLYECAYYPFFNDARQADWVALDKLLARPWWTRTWVVQEVWLATDAILQCGGLTLKWKTFEKAMNYQEGWDDMGYLVKGTKRWASWATLKRRYGLAIHISQKRLWGSKLSDLLWNMWDREVTDPRDKFFAIRGVVGNVKYAALPSVDYSKSVQQVYQDIASFIITEEKSLDILLAASGLDSQSCLPSWVPDWRRIANDRRPALFLNASRMRILCYHPGSTEVINFHGHGYLASGDTEPLVSFNDNLTILRVSGLLFDTIANVAPACGEGMSSARILEEARSTIEQHSVRDGLLPADTANDEELKTILTAGSWIADNSLSSRDQIIENVMDMRRFFITNSNRLCIGPSKAQPGDTVSIIAGCNFPMVLRPQGDYFTVVGEAYVHSYMAGEALENLPEGTSSWVEISLY